MRAFRLSPQDMLFLRDARPMGGADVGRGANWPRPDQLWNALINAFHRAWPERQAWEGAPHHKTDKDKNREKSSDRFGALKSIGPFPFVEETGELLLPCPADLGMKLMPDDGTDLPGMLRYAFLPAKKGKTSHPQWIGAVQYREYLAGGEPVLRQGDDALYTAERGTGIAIDPESGVARDGRLYQSESLRLHHDVSMAFFADCLSRPGGTGAGVDVFSAEGAPERIVFGGQRGIARIEPVDGMPFPFAGHVPAFSGEAPVFLRWTLVTPAVFVNGWRPGWVQEDGAVKLPKGKVERRNRGGREARKKAIDAIGFVEARLVAARVGKPIAFSGWWLGRTDGDGEPKPTLLAVPAGSCYVFSCAGAEEAAALAKVLSFPNPRSDRFGEKGFGIGVCSQISAPEDLAREEPL